MAIMQSCCCWHSVRRGSYACAIYTTIYFTLLALMTSRVLRDENQYLKGDVSLPESISILESGTISPTTVYFNGMLLVCSCCGVVCSLLLLYGLYKDYKSLLIPWMISVVTCGVLDVSHSIYVFVATLVFTPSILMLYTLNFFLLSLNIYSLLCVISQYQEYLAGRGTAAHDYEYRVSIPKVSQREEQWDKGQKVPVVRYVTQPPTTTATTSCLSSRRGATNNETKATPTQSPTACHNPLLSEKTSTTGGRLPRKHVQFPDTSTSLGQIETPELSATEISKKCLPKLESDNATKTWLKSKETITIVVSQSSPSSDEEHIHDS
ncbi:uncharacterized protein LOC109854393 isoform X2 [Pseudomyrmex gracilis]|uniref:uncharacterized protein LOC109854393 isoform X2 n=1 Tax=Pseudomyrmex gracilis TaxID=219809 RepID=UPI0009958858|nr:uncharacterized protein LOC109854393 isoform X2 [Pseudomyrmex gracilis]